MSRSFLHNSLSNFGAALAPALAMLVTLPMVVKQLGTVQFGVYTLVMAITGYFALIDVNVTAGTTKFVAEYLARDDAPRASQVVTFGLCFYLVIGLAGAAALVLSAPWFVDTLFKTPPDQSEVAISALRLAGVGFLFSQLQAYWNSIPQALQRFDITAKLETVFGTLVPVLSAVLVLCGFGLLALVALRVVAPAIHGLILALLSLRLIPRFKFAWPSAQTRRMLWGFSGYSYLSRLASVTFAQGDKIIVGGVLGMAALTHYSVASQLVGRVSSLTFRLSAVMFPTASALEARGQLRELRDLYFHSTRYVTFINGVACGLICLFGREILYYWMGPTFAEQGYAVLVCVTVALFMDSLTNLPSLVNDALGYPRYTGLFAVARVGVSIGLIYAIAVTTGDIRYVALGHTIAALAGAGAFLLYVHGRSLPWALNTVVREAFMPPAIVSVLFAVVFVLRPDTTLSFYAVLVSGTAAALGVLVVAAVWVLLPAHRRMLLEKFRLGPRTGE